MILSWCGGLGMKTLGLRVWRRGWMLEVCGVSPPSLLDMGKHTDLELTKNLCFWIGKSQLATELTIVADEFHIYDILTTPLTIAFFLKEFNVSFLFLLKKSYMPLIMLDMPIKGRSISRRQLKLYNGHPAHRPYGSHLYHSRNRRLHDTIHYCYKPSSRGRSNPSPEPQSKTDS